MFSLCALIQHFASLEEQLELTTLPLYEFTTAHLTYMDKTDVSFLIKACHGVHIALSAIPGITSVLTYEVRFEPHR